LSFNGEPKASADRQVYLSGERSVVRASVAPEEKAEGDRVKDEKGRGIIAAFAVCRFLLTEVK
jgi:hypothetical protein